MFSPKALAQNLTILQIQTIDFMLVNLVRKEENFYYACPNQNTSPCVLIETILPASRLRHPYAIM